MGKTFFIMTPKAVSQIMATCLSSSQYGEVFARDVHCLPTCLLYVLNYFRIKFQPQKTLKEFLYKYGI